MTEILRAKHYPTRPPRFRYVYVAGDTIGRVRRKKVNVRAAGKGKTGRGE